MLSESASSNSCTVSQSLLYISSLQIPLRNPPPWSHKISAVLSDGNSFIPQSMKSLSVEDSPIQHSLLSLRSTSLLSDTSYLCSLSLEIPCFFHLKEPPVSSTTLTLSGISALNSSEISSDAEPFLLSRELPHI